ncbi:sigma factor-like helix-turn-helix DNA-binding protein [Isoptericola jiangsuensis]|uniref:RNA polymerase sigma factor n=1 Tax=Isoptericola jiangsuensis TaxID=548579 RepID=UPI003AAB3DA7
MHPEASDAALWVQVRADDEGAFAVVFDRYHLRVQHTVARALSDVPSADVHAVAAEVFHTAWQRRSGVEVTTSVWPWLRAVTTRLCANERRRCLRQDRLSARAQHTGPADLVEPDHAADVALRVALTTALSRLGSAEAAVAELSIVHDLSDAQVAARLDVPVGTVKSRLHRARRQLRLHLGPDAAAPVRGRPTRTDVAGTPGTATPGPVPPEAPPRGSSRPRPSNQGTSDQGTSDPRTSVPRTSRRDPTSSAPPAHHRRSTCGCRTTTAPAGWWCSWARAYRASSGRSSTPGSRSPRSPRPSPVTTRSPVPSTTSPARSATWPRTTGSTRTASRSGARTPAPPSLASSARSAAGPRPGRPPGPHSCRGPPPSSTGTDP